jgi:hypothetical protein
MQCMSVGVFHERHAHESLGYSTQRHFVVLLFHRWRDLGRRVSFSSLGIAKAFNTELLKGVNSNARKEHIPMLVGVKRVRYDIMGRYMWGGSS